MAVLGNQMTCLDRAKKHYVKSCKEAEKAHDTFKRCDADLNLSRAEVEKARSNMLHKKQACEEARIDYSHLLLKTNEIQVHSENPDVVGFLIL